MMSSQSKHHRRTFLRRAAGTLAASFFVPAFVRAEPTRWGALRGRIVYDGKPPEREKIHVDKDLEYTAKLDIRDESLIVGPGGGLANVYVYLRNPKAPICPELEAAASDTVVLDNRDWIFQPHCLKLWCGKQKLSIVNSDPVAQNVAFAPLGDPPANIVLPVNGKASYQFTRRQSRPVSIACNYHPWERAYILPRDNPYVAVSDIDGTFVIDRLPVGAWQFQAWHERTDWFDAPDWPKGRFEATIQPGMNDLGSISIAAAHLESSP